MRSYMETNRFFRTTCLVAVFTLLSIMLLGLYACNMASPKRTFAVEDLLLDSRELPEDWAVLSVSDRPIVHFGHDEAIEMIFYYVPDSTQPNKGRITISQHRSERRAEQAYTRQERGDFNEDHRSITRPLFVPENFEFISTTADQSQFGCHGSRLEGLFPEQTRCTYLARYNKFVVYLGITIERAGQPIATAEEVERLVIAIDRQMTQHLGNK
jgi:hypothetical protein